MNRYIIVIIVFFCCIYSCVKSEDYVVYARNMSSVSGAILKFGHYNGVWVHEDIYLPQCPLSGVPVEVQSALIYRGGGEMRWEVVKEVGDTAIGSGTLTMASDLWLEVNETNGDWTCTWSDDGW
jgi:hypothetical protein